jgi:hypothetical protein
MIVITVAMVGRISTAASACHRTIVNPLAEPTDLELIRRIATTGGRKYTAGNIDRRKYQRLMALGCLTEASVNISDVLYEVTDAGRAAALRGVQRAPVAAAP